MLQEETLARKFVRKGFWLYFFTFFIGPLGYIVKVLLSHGLSVAEVGMIYGVISFISLISVYNDLGFTESLNFFLPKHIIEKEFGKAKYLLIFTLKIQALSSFLIALILFFLAPWLGTHYFWNPEVVTILRISGLFFIGINMIHLSGVLFSVSQDTKIQKWVELVRILMTTLWVALLFFSNTGNLERYMWAWIGWIVAGICFSLWFFYTRYYRVYFRGVKQIKITSERNHFFRYSLASLLTSNIGTVLSQVDMQLIIVLLGSVATWYYSNYLSLLNITFIFLAPILSFLFPVISELHWRQDTAKMKMIWKQFSLYFSILWVWIWIFLFEFWEPLAVSFFGEKFRESGDILAYSAFFLPFNILTQINFQILAWTGRIKDRIRILLLILPINIILNLIFINLLGVQGSALAVWISWIPLWYLSHRTTREYHDGLQLSPILQNIFLATGALLILVWFQEFVPSVQNIWLLFVAVLVNLAIFAAWNFSILKELFENIRKNRH